MKDAILGHLNNPGALEKMYRANKLSFKREFSALYPELKGNTLADFWNERLNYETEDVYWGSTRDISVVIIASILAGIIAKFPAFFNLDEEIFYQRNIGFIVFPILSLYFAWKNKLKTKTIVFISVAILVFFLYKLSSPSGEKRQLAFSMYSFTCIPVVCFRLCFCWWKLN
jgi:hypothetical protein